jgi:hypothetical protein
MDIRENVERAIAQWHSDVFSFEIKALSRAGVFTAASARPATMKAQPACGCQRILLC